MADQHVIDIADNGSWTIQHTKACPLDERSCPVFKAAEQIVTETDVKPGRFVVELGPLDQLLIGREVDEHGQAVTQEEPVAEQARTRRRAVHLDLGPHPAPSSILVDGVDLANRVSAVRVDAGVHRIPELVLTMPIPVLIAKIEDCDVRLDDATHDALIELGWTPPSPEADAAKDARLNFYAQRHIAKLGLTLASRLLAQLDTYWPSDGELERWRELLEVLVADNFALDPEHDSTAPGGVTDLHGTGRGIHGHQVVGEPLCDPCALLFGEMQRAGLVREVHPDTHCVEQAAHGAPCNEPINDGYCPEHGRVQPTEDARGISDEVLRDLLSLVCVTVPPETLATWTPEQRELAAEWAGATHLQASDNDVTVPPRPAFLDAGIPSSISTSSVDTQLHKTCQCGNPELPDLNHRYAYEGNCDGSPVASAWRKPGGRR